MKSTLMCTICKENIGSIQIHFKDISISKKLAVVNNHNSYPFLVEYNRVYQSGFVDSIIYRCKCGEVVIKNNKSNFLKDFYIADGNINIDDLSKEEYETLKIIVLDNSQEETITKL